MRFLIIFLVLSVFNPVFAKGKYINSIWLS